MTENIPAKIWQSARISAHPYWYCLVNEANGSNVYSCRARKPCRGGRIERERAGGAPVARYVA